MEKAEIKKKVIGAIRDSLSNRYRVIDNTGNDKKILLGQIPDVLIMRQEPPRNNDIIFIMRIETEASLLDSMAEWKELNKIPASLYIVVPETKLDEAKKLVSAMGLFVRFASYSLDHQNKAKVMYE